MTHILLDGRVAGTDGIGRYTRCLLGALQRRPDLRITVLEPTGTPRYSRVEGDELVQAAERCGADLIHIPDFRVPISSAPCPILVTGHDILRLVEPDLCYTDEQFVARFGAAGLAELAAMLPLMHALPTRSSLKARPARSMHEDFCAQMLRLAVDRAAAIIAPTEVVKRQIAERVALPTLLKVSAYGLDHDPFPIGQRPVALPTGRYLLYVGQARAHKGVDVVVAAFAQSAARRAGVRLVLAGRDFAPDGVGATLVNEAGLDDSAVVLGEVDDHALRQLYGAAAALVHLASHEGYGLTPLEAFAAGCRVIASDIPVLRETLGSHAMFVDRDDLSAVAEAMSLTAARIDDVDARSARQMWGSSFTWAGHADAVAEAYKAVLSGG